MKISLPRLIEANIPLKKEEAEKLVKKLNSNTKLNQVHAHNRQHDPDFEDFRRSLKSFSGLTYQIGKGAMVARNGRRMLVGVHVVNEDYFSVLGVPMHSRGLAS